MATPNIVPRADSEGGIGTASKYWASAYIDTIYVGAGKVGRDADNNLDFSTDNNIFFKINGGNEIVMDANRIYPAVNGGSILGHPSYQWADLFLHDGAVINFNNGEVTMTHSGSGDFTIASADDLRLEAGGNDVVLRGASSVEYGRLTNNSGSLTIQNTTADKDISLQAKNTSNGIQEYLRLDGSIAKTTVHRPLKFNDSISAEYGADTDMIMYHSGSTGYIENYTGNFQLIQQVDDGAIVFKCDDGSGGNTEYFKIDGNAQNMLASKNIRFLDGKSVKLGTAGNHAIFFNGTNTLFETKF